MIALSQRTMGNIKQNISIALGLKAVFLATTVVGLSGVVGLTGLCPPSWPIQARPFPSP